MARALLSQPSALRHLLLGHGLVMYPGAAARAGLVEYLTLACPSRRVRLVRDVGWCARIFVLPDRVFAAGEPELSHIYLGNCDTHSFGAAGELRDWQDGIGRAVVGNTRAVTTVSAAFVGPLIRLAGAEPGGLHFHGRSSIGKSTLLIAAGSVWGGDRERGAVNTRSWRTTASALEDVAAAHSDTLLGLEEIGEHDPGTLGATTYMLGNGVGRARVGATRQVRRFTCSVLSTGELTVEEQLRQAGRRCRAYAGQEVRLVGVPAQPHDGAFGIFEALNGFASGAALSQHLKDSARRFYGTPGRAFLEYVVEHQDTLSTDLRDNINRFVDDVCGAETDGQIVRVARRFALIAAAGELATTIGILPWPAGEATRGADACFRAWRANRPGNGGGPSDGARQVLQLVEELAASRFEEWAEAVRPSAADRNGLLGYRRHGEGCVQYWITPDGLRQLCSGHDPKEVAAEFARRGLLRCVGDKTAVSIAGPDGRKARFYHLRVAVAGPEKERTAATA